MKRRERPDTASRPWMAGWSSCRSSSVHGGRSRSPKGTGITDSTPAIDVTESAPCDAGVSRIEPACRDNGHRREMAVERVADAARAFAVHHLDAVGAAQQRAVNLDDDPLKSLLHAESV